MKFLTRILSVTLGLCLIAGSVQAKVAFPLKTGLVEGQAAIVDARGARVRLKSVNWFGAESAAFVVGGLDKQPVNKIAKLIKSGGFNSVRLPWSNEMVESNPIVKEADVAANPQFRGKQALVVFDAVVKALSDEGLMIILDNHRSRGDWCCDEGHGDGLWYTPAYPEYAWLTDWKMMAGRYKANPLVIAAELRNEIRADATTGMTPSWGTNDPATDWRQAAIRGAEAVLKENPRLLIIIGTPHYQTDLKVVRDNPVRLSVPDRLIYAAHDYAWDRKADELADPLTFDIGSWQRWGFVREEGQSFTAPVYISEWGGCVQLQAGGIPCAPDRIAFVKSVIEYQRSSQIDWAWWPLNGTQMAGYNRTKGAVETYGLLKPDWSDWADPSIVSALTAP